MSTGRWAPTIGFVDERMHHDGPRGRRHLGLHHLPTSKAAESMGIPKTWLTRNHAQSSRAMVCQRPEMCSAPSYICRGFQGKHTSATAAVLRGGCQVCQNTCIILSILSLQGGRQCIQTCRWVRYFAHQSYQAPTLAIILPSGISSRQWITV